MLNTLDIKSLSADTVKVIEQLCEDNDWELDNFDLFSNFDEIGEELGYMYERKLDGKQLSKDEAQKLLNTAEGGMWGALAAIDDAYHDHNTVLDNEYLTDDIQYAMGEPVYNHPDELVRCYYIAASLRNLEARIMNMPHLKGIDNYSLMELDIRPAIDALKAKAEADD